MLVKLRDHMGDDLRIYEAAQASLGRTPDRMSPHAAGVIRYMMQNLHGTPFEHPVFYFFIETSIKVARDIMRHRLASFNERSTRYVEMPERFDLPKLEDIRKQVGKPGHYQYVPIDGPYGELIHGAMVAYCEQMFAGYQGLLAVGVAREIASGILPLWLETSFVMTINLRSLFNFLSLRMTGGQAIRELQYIADEMYKQAQPLMPVAFAAWDEANRPSGDLFHDCDSSCSYHEEAS